MCAVNYLDWSQVMLTTATSCTGDGRSLYVSNRVIITVAVSVGALELWELRSIGLTHHLITIQVVVE